MDVNPAFMRKLVVPRRKKIVVTAKIVAIILNTGMLFSRTPPRDIMQMKQRRPT